MFYYDVNRPMTSNASAGTEDNVLALRTAANQRTAAIYGLYVSGRSSSPGGLIIRLKTASTINTGGAAVTPGKRDPDAPAASTSVVDATFTDGTGTVVVRQVVGVAAQGGFGGWFAATPEQSLIMKPNGGANGNAELHNISGLNSTLFDVNLEFAEL